MFELAILDDYQRIALSLADWEPLRDRVNITVFDQALGADAAAKLAPFDIVCMMRERTPFAAALFQALPKLKFMTLTAAARRRSTWRRRPRTASSSATPAMAASRRPRN